MKKLIVAVCLSLSFTAFADLFSDAEAKMKAAGKKVESKAEKVEDKTTAAGKKAEKKADFGAKESAIKDGAKKATK